MPRVGQNPAKWVTQVAKPSKVTVAVLSFIPFQSGYYRQSLEVLQLCLDSLMYNTNLPYDLLVFDNGSCQEVQDALVSRHEAGDIQYLVLSEKNLGKVGAWNQIFAAAPGEYIAYADSDVYFFQGWLSRHLEVFEAFPDVGTVAGTPRRRRMTFSENSIRRASELPGVEVETGKFISESWIRQHARSLDKLDELDENLARDDYLLTSNGVKAYITAQHYQFIVRKDVVRRFLPFPHQRPMGSDVAQFDRAIDGSNLLRLAVADRVAMHIGNRLDEELLEELDLDTPVKTATPLTQRKSPSRAGGGFLAWRPIRRVLLALHDRIFRLYFQAHA
jgi:glycosyltransferase involved in cell wall biosynthesis